MPIDYEVRTRYTIQDDATGKLGKLSQMASAVGTSISSHASALGGMLDSVASKAMAVGAAVAAGAGALAVKGLKTGLVDVNAGIEDATNGFATIFTTLGTHRTFEGGLGSAKKLIEGIREDAKALPGEFQDFVSMAKTLSSPLINAGGDLENIRDLTRQTVVATAALLGTNKGQMQQGAREMAALLEGHAGGHNVLGLRLGITADTKVGNKKWSQAEASERAKYLQNAMKATELSLPAFGKSWSGLVSTMADNMKQFLGRSTDLLFERIKGRVSRLNNLFDNQKGKVDAIADVISVKLAHGFDWVVGKAKWLGEHWGAISSSLSTFGQELHATFVAIWPYVEKIAKVLAHELQDPGKALQKYLGLRAGLGLIGAAPTMIAPAMQMMASSGAGAGVAAAGAEGAAVVGAGEAAAGAAGVAAGGEGFLAFLAAAAQGLSSFLVALGPVFLVVGGLIGVFDNATRQTGLYGEKMDQAAQQQSAINALFSEHFGKMVDLVKEIGSKLWDAFRPIFATLGPMLVGALEIITLALTGLLLPINALVSAFKWASEEFFGSKRVEKLQSGNLDGIIARQVNITRGFLMDKEFNRQEKEFARLKDVDDRWNNIKNQPKPKDMKGGGATNVVVHAPLTVLSDADPERLAVKVAHHIDTQLRNPTRGFGLQNRMVE